MEFLSDSSKASIDPPGSRPIVRNEVSSGVSILHDAPLLGRSAAFLKFLKQLKDAARSIWSVKFDGESGIGKSRGGREVHNLSSRREGPFLICSVANLPDTLAQSELVGHVKGSFSGADSDKLGLLRSADGGGICFDDVDKLPLSIQPYLLHFLDTHEVRPIGSARTFKVNTRVMATTNQDLPQLVARGLFMRDLMYRLGEIEIRIPPLRERREDIAPLVQYLTQVYALEQREAVPAIDPAAMVLLESSEWPGNCRDVAKAVLHCVLSAERGRITPEIVATAPGFAGPAETPLAELGRLAALPENERRSKGVMVRALEVTKGKVKEAASGLGITYRTFQRDCQRHGIRVRGE